MKITYLYHSGFLVETKSAILLFDYYKGKLPSFQEEKPLIIFASHKHPDHFDFKIFDFQDHPGGVAYVFGNDIKLSENYLQRRGINPAVKENIHRMSPHKELVLPLKGEGAEEEKEHIIIHTLKSTDAGVAFYVKTENERLYHGGDLNWWHWEGETEAFNRQQERIYKEEIHYLKELLEKEAKEGKEAKKAEEVKAAKEPGRLERKETGTEYRLDAAFIPLDPRLQEAYSYGMDYFLSQIPVKEVFPMHMWEDYEVIGRYLKHCARREDTGQFAQIIKNPLG